MGINKLLEMSRRSFHALDAAMNTTGQNVANAETEGYTRRRVTFQSDQVTSKGLWSQLPPGVMSGVGVSIDRVTRARDDMLLRASWLSKSTLGAAEEDQRIASALEGLFPTHSEGALLEQLNAFWNSWGDLADNPTDISARQAILGKAVSFTNTLGRITEEAHNLKAQTGAALEDSVDEANRLIERIYELNKEVVASTHLGSPNLAAMDERDKAIGKLSEFAPVKVRETAGGGLNVRIDGIEVVNENSRLTLNVEGSDDAPRVVFEDTNLALRADNREGGRLGALVYSLTHTIPDTLAGLDTLAETVVTEVNALHRTGYGLDGSTGTDFFDPTGTTAGTMSVSDAVLADATVIAASQQDTSQDYHDSQVALGIAALRDAKLFDGGADTSEGYVVTLVTGLGAQVDQAKTRYEAQASYASHVESMERGVSGVSIEEEMTSLIQYQHAYQASARVLNTAQEMMDVLLTL